MGYICYLLCNEYCIEKIYLFNNFKLCVIGVVYIYIMIVMMVNNYLFLFYFFFNN